MSHRLKNSLDHHKRVRRALVYIRDNIDKPLSLKEVSASACFSPYHFHRIFTSFMQETFGEYITRKKIETAAIRLAYSPHIKISHIAFECGYSSASNFSKAFNRWFGCRPTEITTGKRRLRSGAGKLQTKYKKSIDLDKVFGRPCRRMEFEKIDDRVEVRQVPGFELRYLASPGGYDYVSVSRTWKKLIELLEDNHIDINECGRFAFCHDHPGLAPASRCRYDACVVLPSKGKPPSFLPGTKVPSGRYAVFSAKGAKESILDQYLEFYTVWIPQSGYVLDNFPAIDRYISPFNETDIKVELWTKIKRVTMR